MRQMKLVWSLTVLLCLGGCESSTERVDLELHREQVRRNRTKQVREEIDTYPALLAIEAEKRAARVRDIHGLYLPRNTYDLEPYLVEGTFDPIELEKKRKQKIKEIYDLDVSQVKKYELKQYERRAIDEEYLRLHPGTEPVKVEEPKR